MYIKCMCSHIIGNITILIITYKVAVTAVCLRMAVQYYKIKYKFLNVLSFVKFWFSNFYIKLRADQRENENTGDDST